MLKLNFTDDSFIFYKHILYANNIFIWLRKNGGRLSAARKARIELDSPSRILNHDETLKAKKEWREARPAAQKWERTRISCRVYTGEERQKTASRTFRATEQCGLKRRHRDAENALRFVCLHLVRLITDLGGHEVSGTFLRKDKGNQDNEGRQQVQRYIYTIYLSKLNDTRSYVLPRTSSWNFKVI